MHILFSLPVHDNNDIVRLTIANAKQHVPDCTIVLHVSLMFHDFDWSIGDIQGVIINPMRLHTVHGNSQFGIHLWNHEFALDRCIPYGVFCVLHTSEMFVRPGLNDVVSRHPYALWYDRNTMPRQINWSPMHMAKSANLFSEALPDHSWYLGSLLEGMWIHRHIMQVIFESCQTAPALLSPNIDWTLEEFALPTLTNWFGGEHPHGEPYNAFFDKSFIEISDVDRVLRGDPVELWAKNCWNTSGIPVMSDGATKYSVKRLPRDINDPVRQHIIKVTGLDLSKVLV